MGHRLRPLIAVGSVLITVVMTSMNGTYARWQDAIPLNGGTVRAGRLSLVVGDDQTRSTSYALSTLTAAALGPSGWAQAPLTLTNAGDGPLRWTFSGSTATGSTSVAAAMTLSLITVGARSGCPAGVGAAAPASPGATVYDGPLAGSGSATDRRLAVGAADVLCVRATLGSGAGSSLAGGSTGVRLTFTARST